MGNNNLLFYNEYEEFYDMVKENEVFSRYCEKVFGIDFSQDGFSDIKQINDLIRIADLCERKCILDIGCGNGKMLEYIHEKTGVKVYGFDYSKRAIKSACDRTLRKREKMVFEVGFIGEMQYKASTFDVILSIDTMYFAKDMKQFLNQINTWLKPGGLFLAFYGEGHLKEKSIDQDSTELAFAFKNNGIEYKVIDYTKKHYDLMKYKRQVAIEMKEEFLKNNLRFYYDCAIHQSTDMEFEEFLKRYNRYLYASRKKN